MKLIHRASEWRSGLAVWGVCIYRVFRSYAPYGTSNTTLASGISHAPEAGEGPPAGIAEDCTYEGCASTYGTEASTYDLRGTHGTREPAHDNCTSPACQLRYAIFLTRQTAECPE